MVPYANQTKLTKLLRKYGFPVKRNQIFRFERLKHSFFLEWREDDFGLHLAHYFACCGRPVLMVDGNLISITMDDVKEFGLFKFTLRDQPPIGG